jgi:hypothetical protein
MTAAIPSDLKPRTIIFGLILAAPLWGALWWFIASVVG